MLNDVYARRILRAQVRFLCVYIREAHAMNVWPIDGPEVLEPQSTEERVRIAREFQRSCGLSWPIAVDGVEDAFLRAFAPWPFRLYVVRGARLALKTSPVQGTHSTDDVEAALRAFEAASEE